MSVCCDAAQGDSCPCWCHDWKRPEDPEVEDWAALGESILEGFRAGIRQWLDMAETDPLHPLLYPDGIPPVIPPHEAPPVDPEAVTWAADKVRVIQGPSSPSWTSMLDAMPATPGGQTSLDAIYAWAAQRAIERRILEEMAAILEARPADAPGVLLIHYPEETVMTESQWIPSGTLIYSMQDQPDLMVKVDPDSPNVLYYRQTGWPPA